MQVADLVRPPWPLCTEGKPSGCKRLGLRSLGFAASENPFQAFKLSLASSVCVLRALLRGQFCHPAPLHFPQSLRDWSVHPGTPHPVRTFLVLASFRRGCSCQQTAFLDTFLSPPDRTFPAVFHAFPHASNARYLSNVPNYEVHFTSIGAAHAI